VRKLPGIWYQVDSDDADLATFFYYLGHAAVPFTRKRQQPLPALTPEYLHDIPGFTRRFFRELFSRLPNPSMLVLDNLQEVAPDHSFHEVISEAIGQAVADEPAGEHAGHEGGEGQRRGALGDAEALEPQRPPVGGGSLDHRPADSPRAPLAILARAPS